MEFDVLTAELARDPAFEATAAAVRHADRRATIRVSARLKASPERVFDAWLTPAIAGKWLFATASRPMSRVTIDPRIGGAFRFVDRNDGDHIEYTGVYLESVRPRHLAFTVSVETQPRTVARVAVEIVPLSRGGPAGCEIVVAHEDLPPELASRMEARWTGMLYGLGQVLAGARPQAR